MPDRPIIFSAPMVRALLEGRKTQTRRVLKDQPTPNEPIGGASPYGQDWVWQHGTDGSVFRQMLPPPPYAPGDRLYVREAWCTSPAYDDIKPSEMGGDESIRYAADGTWESWGWGNLGCVEGRARSPIHMPRWASRLTLTVTDVRVQRLQEISEADAMAEGIHRNTSSWFPIPGVDGSGTTARAAFAGLWNSIHGDTAWDANPWVAAITFTVQHGNINQMEAA